MGRSSFKTGRVAKWEGQGEDSNSYPGPSVHIADYSIIILVL